MCHMHSVELVFRLCAFENGECEEKRLAVNLIVTSCTRMEQLFEKPLGKLAIRRSERLP